MAENMFTLKSFKCSAFKKVVFWLLIFSHNGSITVNLFGISPVPVELCCVNGHFEAVDEIEGERKRMTEEVEGEGPA